MATVRLSDVRKVYDNGYVAVHESSFEVADGEFVVLVGPSGCGKSTTLRMIAGLEDISSGDLFIGERRVNDVEPKDRDIAMVFQNYALYPHMTVYENMAFGLKLRKFSKDEIDQRVRQASAILGLDKELDRKPKQLSGGQRQRVAVGRAIVRKPQVFLFDEPLSNLDAKLRVQMRTEISKLHSQLKATMIYVTHDQVEAMTMGDRIVVMLDGYVQQIDTPLNLYRSPVNQFVGGFIGSPSMNFVAGTIVPSDAGVAFDAGEVRARMPLASDAAYARRGLAPGRNVTLGVRPEYLSVAMPEAANFTATVDVIEPMGSETVVYARLGDAQIVARVAPSVRPDAGATIYLKADPHEVHLFDAETQQSLALDDQPVALGA
jgi:multiple sugar transport system ATP-binding protein